MKQTVQGKNISLRSKLRPWKWGGGRKFFTTSTFLILEVKNLKDKFVKPRNNQSPLKMCSVNYTKLVRQTNQPTIYFCACDKNYQNLIFWRKKEPPFRRILTCFMLFSILLSWSRTPFSVRFVRRSKTSLCKIRISII